MKLYICGPMTGLPELNFPAFFEAQRKLMDAGYTVLNPADRAGRVAGQPWEWYLRRGILDVCMADGVAHLPGWAESRGAQLETHVASELGMPVLNVGGWLSLSVCRVLE